MGGLLYGVIRGWDWERCLRFGFSAGAMAVTFATDYVMPEDEEQIWAVWEKDARVLR